MKFKALITLLTALAVCLSFSGCKKTDKSIQTVAGQSYDFSASTLAINRPTREINSPMGEEGTWTVFVYMCGSDLESTIGAASKDIAEMLSASSSDKVKFVIETGGASQWVSDISSDYIQRYEISGGKLNLVGQLPKANMGESSTLSDFLDWGISNYPAGNMGLILWDHGSGSINGVCNDENYDFDSLYIKELDNALYGVYDKMTEPFEFIGFDACLMATSETAAILSTHAKYMVASQETEPGTGWDYKAIGDYLASTPKADGAELGKEICDSFYNSCSPYSAPSATLSVIDLSKMDTFLKGFDIFSKDIEQVTSDQAAYYNFYLNSWFDDRFGTYEAKRGIYTNSIDLGGLVKANKDLSSVSNDVLSALSDCVVYKKNGFQHSDASGLSIYYPVGINIYSYDQEFGIFKDVCISQNYYNLVFKVVKTSIELKLANLTAPTQSTNDWSKPQGNASYTPSTIDWNLPSDYSISGHSSAVTFSSEPALDSSGNYTFTLSPDALGNVMYVEASVYYWLDDHKNIFELGDTGNVDADLKTGVVKNSFDGKWFSLPDGQVLSVYLLSKGDDVDFYYSPIMLNDKLTNLRFMHDRKTGEVTILDTCEDSSESGMSARSVSLTNGDVIKPVHYVKNIYTNEKNMNVGKKYTFDGSKSLTFAMLPKGKYWYTFRINDIYGDYYETDPSSFDVKEDSDGIHFNDEHHTYAPATCTKPETCVFCGKTKGKAAGHKWKKATCTKPKTCKVCGKKEGKSAGHKWKDATFSTPKTCEVCGKEDGDPLSAPIGSGYVDYVVLDVDNDGEDELVEVYEEDNDLAWLKYRIYNTKNDHNDIYAPLNGASEIYSAIVYDYNRGGTYFYWYSSSDGGFRIYDFGKAYDTSHTFYNDTPVIKVPLYFEEIDGQMRVLQKDYYNFDKKIKRKQMENYIDNITILYSYNDPNGENLRTANKAVKLDGEYNYLT